MSLVTTSNPLRDRECVQQRKIALAGPQEHSSAEKSRDHLAIDRNEVRRTQTSQSEPDTDLACSEVVLAAKWRIGEI